MQRVSAPSRPGRVSAMRPKPPTTWPRVLDGRCSSRSPGSDKA